jgi:uncharacterized repeat protein (TIGR03803 family)
MHKLSFTRSSSAYFVKSTLFAMALLAFAPPDAASAATLRTLHSFCTDTNCTDGDTPLTGLVMDSSGNLYGTTEVGGKYNRGLVFELTPNANKTKYKEHILKNFCAKLNCTDGSYPFGALILDSDGALYGTTGGGGKFTGGTVFKLTHAAGVVTFAVVHSFCSKSNCTDGSDPNAGLAYAGQASGAPWDKSSPLFGTTYFGGASNRGEVYELLHTGSAWSFQVIHSYSSGFHGGDLLMDPSGNLLGTTLLGGANGGGTLYRLAAGTWNETTLHNFCADANCADGMQPEGRLLMDSAGNLFGTASEGGSGAHCTTSGGCGVAFERTSGGTYNVIYDFCSRAACRDGEVPSAGPIMNAAGDLVGTTYGGGTGTGGTAFSLHHGTSWTEAVLYNFCSEQNCTDGGDLDAPLILDSAGNLFGTAGAGGANGDFGTVFELTP